MNHAVLRIGTGYRYPTLTIYEPYKKNIQVFVYKSCFKVCQVCLEKEEGEREHYCSRIRIRVCQILFSYHFGFGLTPDPQRC